MTTESVQILQPPVLFPDVMLDVETLSTKPYAVIAVVAAVPFDITGKIPVVAPAECDGRRTFYSRVKTQDCIRRGMVVDGDTIAWWMQQSEAARREIFDEDSREDLKQMLTRLFGFLSQCRMASADNIIRIWGHGAAFDPVIVNCGYDIVDELAPWSYRETRDTRTLYDLYQELTGEEVFKPDNEVPHHAAWDAYCEAQRVIHARNHILQAGCPA